MKIKKLTSILLIESIEAALPFWKALGFEVTTQVPHGEKLGFVIMNCGGIELMLQTRSSVEADLSSIADTLLKRQVLLYGDVDSLDAAEKAVGKDCEIVVPRRKTFYGAHETWVREPSGNIVGFAQF